MDSFDWSDQGRLIAYLQLNGHLSAEDLLPRNQSAYRKQHSAETALIRVLTDNE